MDKNTITIAIPKGRLMSECMKLFFSIGLAVKESPDRSRKLLFPSEDGSVRFLIVRDKDLPTYVEYGAADMGIAGKDVLMEAGKDLLEPLDLGFGFCRIVLAKPATAVMDATGWGRIRVATGFPKITMDYFAEKGEQVEIIPLYGSIELAPLVNLADRIVDLISTGETLRQNNLVEIEEVLQVTARLVVNRASLKTRSDRIMPLIEAMTKVIAE